MTSPVPELMVVLDTAEISDPVDMVEILPLEVEEENLSEGFDGSLSVTTMNIRSKAVNNAVSPPTEEREKTKKRKRSNPQKGEDQSKKVKKQEQTGPGLPPGEWLQQDEGDSHV